MQFYLSILWVVLIVVFAVVEVSTAQLVSIWFVGGSVAAALFLQQQPHASNRGICGGQQCAASIYPSGAGKKSQP